MLSLSNRLQLLSEKGVIDYNYCQTKNNQLQLEYYSVIKQSTYYFYNLLLYNGIAKGCRAPILAGTSHRVSTN